ncbi:MAG TPA: CBS domain-containing protein [Solirubrobacteraceae bacterium]|jgi:CBS domain-containing protein|nr:CBS domain-containing protein [Solirubrobacteraceae bacterium]
MRPGQVCSAGCPEDASFLEVHGGADDSAEEALRTMSEHKVRRLPVIDGHELIGVISQGDLATELGPDRVGELVGAISS